MLETIAIGLLILSVLVYGFWQLFIKSTGASKKSKQIKIDEPSTRT